VTLGATVGTDRGRTTLRFLALPAEAGVDGRSIQAGHVLEWIDRAGFACAAAWSSSYCVTAYVGNVHFTRPIRVGDLVEAEGRIISTGRTSMQVLVTVANADPTVGTYTPATHCLLVFVAVDADRTPRPVPQWTPSNVAELDLTDRGRQRVAARSRIRAAMEAEAYTGAGTAPRTVLRFLAQPADVNWGGTVHGGTVMRWIDEAAQACATGWTRRPTVGVYAGGIHFHRPIAIGAVVEVESRIIHTGPHSLHVATHVRSRPVTGGPTALTTQCMTISVCPDEDGTAGAVDPVPLVSDEDVRLDRHARALVAMRAELDAIGEQDA
jgi:4-hydroxybenzoyl-CoA thioesterase